MKKVTPFKEREPMSQYEIHTTVFQYIIILLMIVLAVTFWFMRMDIAKLAS